MTDFISATKKFTDSMTKDDAIKFLRLVMGPPSRELEGEEYNHMTLILAFLKPIRCSNNQVTVTHVYHHNDNIYKVHYGREGNHVIDEIKMSDMIEEEVDKVFNH